MCGVIDRVLVAPGPGQRAAYLALPELAVPHATP